MIKKVKVVDFSDRRDGDLFALGNRKGEFYFVNADSTTMGYLDELESRVRFKLSNARAPAPYALVDISGRSAKLIDPAEIGDIFVDYEVNLDYHNSPPRGITVEPWNGAGDLSHLTYVAKGYDFELHSGREIDPDFKALVENWTWIMNVGSRDNFYQYCRESPPVKVIEECSGDGITVFDMSDQDERDRIYERVISKKMDEITEAAVDKNVDLVLIGLFTPDNYSHFSGGHGDMCNVNENGLDLVNRLRSGGYQGNIVALRACPYTIPDTYFNKMALYSLHEQGVILSPSTKSPTLTQILTGGRFISQYSLDGTPQEMDTYRKENDLTSFDPVRPI